MIEKVERVRCEREIESGEGMVRDIESGEGEVRERERVWGGYGEREGGREREWGS